MQALLDTIYDLIWNPLVYVTLISGLAFTIATRAVQVRHLPNMVKCLFGRANSDTGTSSFQAFAMALGGRVGVGNIAGVATAIAFGGPGALFWMIATAIITASSAFIEATLGQIYKVKSEGEYRGGIPWYIEKGLGLKWLAVTAAAVAVLCYTLLIPGVQSSTIVTSLATAFSIPTWISGLILVALTALVVFGGTRRIAAFAEKAVPAMAAAYVLLAIVVLIVNFQAIPEVIRLVLSSAFGTDAIFGGMIGAAISWGVRRSLYSNVAGVGEGAFAGAAASVSHPVKQGLVQSFSVYIDTVLVCSATGVMILSTGAYNILPEGQGALVENLPGVEAGAGFTQVAVDTIIPGVNLGAGVVAIAIFFFAFTSILSYFYYAVTNIVYLTGGSRGVLARIVQAGVLLSVYLGTVRSTEMAWTLGDIGYGIMAWFNMVAIAFLCPIAVRALRDYERQKKLGLDPVFNPAAAGIKGATFWDSPDAPAHLHATATTDPVVQHPQPGR
ncbi:alanine:cation symporter family protein [Arthrobacter sp. BB-1]|uniref:alanine/glycine:cation symporter family protein n=1 Tax=unclassified Arthrobacter TaxID=235627 RepID=UPI0010D4FE79|nr:MULTISPECIES: alanine/glycine:cation symporter family protein [unclassified Arthrobacter]TNB67247.1 alanine:cation symporter family protein [Arthrobacter sp. BB-1]VII98738.1 Putative sodium/proton-dependent alanine carrier protein YrbD [Arthrobacter sp. DR-2P]